MEVRAKDALYHAQPAICERLITLARPWFAVENQNETRASSLFQ
jgi:hypothetical protein